MGMLRAEGEDIASGDPQPSGEVRSPPPGGDFPCSPAKESEIARARAVGVPGPPREVGVLGPVDPPTEALRAGATAASALAGLSLSGLGAVSSV